MQKSTGGTFGVLMKHWPLCQSVFLKGASRECLISCLVSLLSKEVTCLDLIKGKEQSCVDEGLPISYFSSVLPSNLSR